MCVMLIMYFFPWFTFHFRKEIARMKQWFDIFLLRHIGRFFFMMTKARHPTFLFLFSLADFDLQGESLVDVM